MLQKELEEVRELLRSRRRLGKSVKVGDLRWGSLSAVDGPSLRLLIEGKLADTNGREVKPGDYLDDPEDYTKGYIADCDGDPREIVYPERPFDGVLAQNLVNETVD